MSFESELSDALRSLAGELPDENSYWKEYLVNEASKLDNTYATMDTQSKYRCMRSLEGLYGGMGSLNDLFLDGEAEEKRDKLYILICGELRVLWKDMGNEAHDIEKICPYTVGTVVKLVSGKPRYIGRDGVTEYVPRMRWVDEQTWVIGGILGPDISNMLLYDLVQGTKHLAARHDSVKPVGGDILSALKSLFSG